MSTNTITDAIVGMAEALAVVRDLPLISVLFDHTSISQGSVRVHLMSDNYAQVRAWNPEGVETTEVVTLKGDTSTFYYLKVGRIEVLAIFDEAPDRADLGDERDYS
jgi:hypothetical protein